MASWSPGCNRAQFSSVETDTRTARHPTRECKGITRLGHVDDGLGVQIWLGRRCPHVVAGTADTYANHPSRPSNRAYESRKCNENFDCQDRVNQFRTRTL